MKRVRFGLSVACLAFACLALGDLQAIGPQQQPPQTASLPPALSPQKTLVDRYCVTCHNEKTRRGGLTLDTKDPGNVGSDADVWEKVVRKLRAGLMPPVGM